MKMDVTVIIPMFNAEKTIGRCVKSAAGQAVREILLVDDGSEDGTMKEAGKLALQFPEVRILQQKHGGVSRARNLGIREARGEWILFLDADDSLAEGAVRCLADLVKEHRTDNGENKERDAWIHDLVLDLENEGERVCRKAKEKGNCTARENIAEGTGIRTDACCGRVVRGNMPAALAGCACRYFAEKHDLLNYVLEAPTDRLTIHGWMFRRCICTEQEIFFQPELRLGEDSDWVLRYLSACHGAVFTERPVYQYTISPDSAIHHWKPGQTEGYLKMLEMVGSTPASRERNWPLFVLTNLLLILTHDTFHPANPAGRRRQIREAARLRNLPVFAEAFEKADLSGLDGKKRIVLQCMKSGRILPVWAAVKIRQMQNAGHAK